MSTRAGVVARWAAWRTSRETVVCGECGETVTLGQHCPECGQVATAGGRSPMVGMLATVVDLLGGGERLVVAERRTPAESWVPTKAVPVTGEAIRMLARQADQTIAGGWNSTHPQPLGWPLTHWLAASHGDTDNTNDTAGGSRSHEQGAVRLW